MLRFRLLSLAASIILVAFNALLGIWPMVAMNFVLAGINIWFVVKLSRNRHDVSAYEVLEVRQDDAYLHHILRLHERDIRQFFPDVCWNDSVPERAAFLVLSGDESIGIVLVRDAGDGVAQVELDYVTPRFRDFSPGEFVYQRSGLFREHGCCSILSPPGMVAPYYDRLGFRRDGASHRLDLV